MSARQELPMRDLVLDCYSELVSRREKPREIGQVVLFDLHRKEIAKPKVITPTKLEHTIAKRGLWNHLAVVRKAPRASMQALDTVDESITNTLASMGVLQRAYDRDEDLWDGEAVFDDEDIMAELIRAKFADDCSASEDWLTRQDQKVQRDWLLGQTKEEMYGYTPSELTRRAKQLNERQAIRRRISRDEFEIILTRFASRIFHEGLIELAKSIRDKEY